MKKTVLAFAFALAATLPLAARTPMKQSHSGTAGRAASGSLSRQAGVRSGSQAVGRYGNVGRYGTANRAGGWAVGGTTGSAAAGGTTVSGTTGAGVAGTTGSAVGGAIGSANRGAIGRSYSHGNVTGNSIGSANRSMPGNGRR